MMKKCFVAIFAIVLAISMFSACATESITFRDISWYTTESEAIAAMNSVEGAKVKSPRERKKIGSWYQEYSSFLAEPFADEAGVLVPVSNLPVAGYNVYANLYFIYPIKDGRVDYTTENSELFKAIYVIDDLEDIEGAYEDLLQKLTGVYGDGEDKTFENDYTSYTSVKGHLWRADDGSLIWLHMYYNSAKDKYDEIQITYAAPDLDARITEISEQISAEASEAEANAREENASNTSGL